MQTDDLVIYTGTGTDRKQLDPSGPQPTNLTATANEWGPDTATFDLARTPDIPWADLTPRTPVEIEIGGVRVWKGRIKATPARPDTVTVECEGLQYALDDIPFQRLYVHNNPSSWDDWRNHPDANLSVYTSGYEVNTGGVIRISNSEVTGVFPKGGVYIDLGFDDAAKKIVVEWSKNTWAGTGTAYFFASDTATDLNTAGGGSSTTIIDLASGTTSGTFETTMSARYLHVFCDTNTAQASDRFFRIGDIRIFGDSNWEDSSTSVLKSSQVVADAILQGKGWTDTSRIATTTGNLIALDALEYRTARDLIDTVNQFENYVAKVDADGIMVFQPKEVTPSISIRGDYMFTDGNLNSADDIYDEVVVLGTQGGKIRVSETRTQTGTIFDQLTNEGNRHILDISGGSITSLFAQTLGDKFLEAHRYAPFKGDVTVTGDQNTRGAGGQELHASRLLRDTGAMAELQDRIDPTRGVVGRRGYVVAVKYAHDSRTAEVALDSSRRDFAQMLARYLTGM